MTMIIDIIIAYTLFLFILSCWNYRFINERSKNVIQGVCDELIRDGISQEKVETLIANIVDVVRNDI